MASGVDISVTGPQPGTHTFLAHSLAGAAAGMAETAAMYPLDTIKTRMQVTQVNASAVLLIQLPLSCKLAWHILGSHYIEGKIKHSKPFCKIKL